MTLSTFGVGSLGLAVLGLAACAEGSRTEPPAGDPAPAAAARPTPPPPPWTPSAIAHCGSGTPVARGGGCPVAVDAALQVLASGGDPLDAAVAGVVRLEDDPRYNAGTGANVRLDGRTIQMDAAVMDSRGRYGAVAVIEGVRNPVLVARAVADTPHRLIAGEGATALARALGHAPYDPTTPESLADSNKMRARLLAGDSALPASWRGFDWRKYWNFDAPPPSAPESSEGAPGAPAPTTTKPAPATPTTGQAPRLPAANPGDSRSATGPAANEPRGATGPAANEPRGPSASQPGGASGDSGDPEPTTDTVGVLVRGADGRFGAALSTGGWTLMLRGRVGDTPLPGAGLYAGPAGAVAGTGRGEKIIDVLLARTVYGWLEQGMSAADAARRGVELLGGEGGLIVMTPTDSAAAAGREMAWCSRDRDGPPRGP